MTKRKGVIEKSMENFDEKFRQVCDFYVVTHKLKNLLRKGWIDWKVNSERIESVAEHVYGTQMLAFAIKSEFQLDVDIEKVVFMLAFHELGECLIGDISLTDERRAIKAQIEKEAVEKILAPVRDKQRILDLIDEYVACQTKEAKFAKFIDKFECDMQCKFYEEMGQTYSLSENLDAEREISKKSKEYHTTKISKMWIENHKKMYGYDEFFKELADFVIENDIYKKK